jgi:tRNA pseudouridine38-40 synthase
VDGLPGGVGSLSNLTVAIVRVDLAYDGTGFHGYARNPGVRTVQEDLERALETVLRSTVSTTVAGRTDAGVHARGQVVSFEADPAVDVGRVERSLRRLLAPEIAVRSVVEAPDGFDARFSASRRHYRYFVDEAPVPDPLRRHTVWHVGEVLAIDEMNRAAAAYVGTHDFASLCRSQEGKTTERTVVDAVWRRQGGLTVYEVSATAFCHQMVRSMVALCIDVGRGRVEADAVPAILEAKDRNAARGAAPPHGLILWQVDYE